MDSLIDYMHYLKLEIAQLRAQLADALADGLGHLRLGP